MQVGAKKINVQPNSIIHFDSDTRIVCFALRGSDRIRILGSGTKFRVTNDDAKKIEVWTTDTAFWTYNQVQLPLRNDPVDPRPMELHVEDKPPSLRDEMRDYIREILSTQARDDGQETFEESMDFDIEDEFDPTSPYEMQDMVTEYADLPTEPPPEPLGETSDESDTNMAEQVNDAVSENTERPMDT